VTNDDEREWNAWADMLGIADEDRVSALPVPVSDEVEREKLVRVIARGRRAEAQLQVDRELAADADADDTTYVDYEEEDDDDALIVTHAERPAWRHPRAVTS